MKYLKIFFTLLVTNSVLFSQATLTSRLIDKLNQASNLEYIRVLCLLKDRVDVNALDKYLYDINATPQERAFIVITSLQDKANQTQTRLKNFLNAKLNTNELKSYESFWITNMIMVEATKSLIFELANHPDIDLIDIDAFLKLEPYTFEGTAPENIEGTETGLKVIGADKLWRIGITGDGRLVMGIDTGVEGSHPAFNTRWRGNFAPANQAWFDPETNTTFPTDCDNHGTHTMGTMCGRQGSDTIGVAFEAQWIAAKTICSSPHTSKSISAFQWAMNPDGNPTTIHDMPDVINNSWYDPNSTSTQCTGIYKTTLDAVEAAGIAVVFSAGNQGPNPSTITSPKNINTNEVNVFCVGNINGNTVGYPIANSSSRGPSTCGGTGSLLIKPEVVAPGTNVRSAIRGGAYGLMSGTSMASPHVAGAVALLKQAFPNLTGKQIKLALYNTAVDLGSPGEDNTYGKGLIDVYAAFIYLSSRDSTPPSRITNLQVINSKSNSITLSWTVPSDSSVGGVVEYDIRYRTSGPITDTISFNSAIKINNPPKPDSSGKTQTFTVSGLSFNTTYYFAIRSMDIWNNWSEISNSPNGTTLAKPIIAVSPDSLNLFKPKDITFSDSIRISNTNPQPSTLDFTIELQNHTFPTKNVRLSLEPILTENEKTKASENKEANIGGNGFSIYGSGGPDQFGYRWKDSDDPSGPRFSWSSISTIGTRLTLTDDSYSTQSLPFQFNFYGTSYSQVEVVSNGYLRFSNFTSTYPTNGTIPSTAAPNNAIYGFWDDLNPGAGGDVYVHGNDQRFIVEFNNVPRYNDASTTVTFQIELRRNGTIIYRYLRMIGILNSATIGIENSNGTIGLQVVYNSNYVKDSLAIRFQKEPDWLNVTQLYGSVFSGNSMRVVLQMNTNELQNGLYRMELVVKSNDSTSPNVIIPVRLNVTDSTFIVVSSFPVSGGWNLISVPIQTFQVRKNELFPTSNSYAYGFSNNYVIKDTLLPGYGYWLKFPSTQNIELQGMQLFSVNVPLNTGWNLIGSLNQSFPVSALSTDPPNLIASYIYGYGPAYYIANTIEKGKGYWVKASSNGSITLNSTFAKENINVNDLSLALNNATEIEVKDAEQKVAKLYLTSANDLEKFELPPQPPIGIYDVRFSSNKLVKEPSSDDYLLITSAKYPVELSIRNSNERKFIISDITGEKLRIVLANNESVILSDPSLNVLKISEVGGNLSYELMQNYPNPFNPSTTIKFSIPEKTRIKLILYNSLGEIVQTLADDEFNEGLHSITLDGSSLSSGIYFYTMISSKFVQTKKLLLMK